MKQHGEASTALSLMVGDVVGHRSCVDTPQTQKGRVELEQGEEQMKACFLSGIKLSEFQSRELSAQLTSKPFKAFKEQYNRTPQNPQSMTHT